MLYSENLEDILFTKHEFGSEIPDEIIIISGYIGPSPIEKLKDLPMKATVIGGMYTGGIDKRMWESLENAKAANSNLNILFTQTEIHSKIYIWRKNKNILYALIGSANFSSNGLRKDYRETLADATRDTYKPLQNYYKFIRDHSLEVPKISDKKDTVEYEQNKVDDDPFVQNEIKYSITIPLYDFDKDGNKFVYSKSGLNWGLSKGHVAPGDGYIRLPKKILKNNQQLIKPYHDEYINPLGKKKRNSDPIELIWDDGVIMDASLEGEQMYNKLRYPKQLASFSNHKRVYLEGKRISAKSILGRYIRNRLGVDLKHQITIEDLENYGRDTITLSLLEEGVYYADFSVEN